MMYALFINGEFQSTRRLPERPPHIPHKNVEWYPVGTSATTEVEADAGWTIISDEAVENVYVSPPPPPTTDDVTAYAEQLIENGVTINVTGITAPIYVQGRAKDKDNIAGLKDGAVLRQLQQAPSASTQFRDGNNVMHTLNDAQLIEMWAKGAAYVQAVYAVSFDMKDNDPVIAEDFRNDPRWPDPDQTNA